MIHFMCCDSDILQPDKQQNCNVCYPRSCSKANRCLLSIKQFLRAVLCHFQSETDLPCSENCYVLLTNNGLCCDSFTSSPKQQGVLCGQWPSKPRLFSRVEFEIGQIRLLIMSYHNIRM